MAPRKRSPQSWDIDSLLVLGKKEGEKANYLKAVPVLILEKWVQEGRDEQGANVVTSARIARRLESSGLVSFKPKGTAIVLAALTRIQRARNLTNPWLIEYDKEQESFKVNLPRYEPLLQGYRREYYKRYRDDYDKLFSAGEPEWEPPKLTDEREEHRAESDVHSEMQTLFAPVEKALREHRQTMVRLLEENRNLRAQLETKASEIPGVSFVHTSPDFHRSEYNGKITSIKDTVGNMLKRADSAIRISTRQMDLFTDELIALKRRNPEMEIVVLSRGPQGAEGDRKRIAGVAFERMKQAGIKLPVDKDTLHSRLIVIDAKEVLVSSADLDFTHMELEFNAGIWTNNPQVVAEALRYFDNSIALTQGN